jgi:alpha-methylacyl-CoA racemase
MLLANLGAEVVRLRRPGETRPVPALSAAPSVAGRPSVTVDLKSQRDRQFVLDLVSSADAVMEGMRPGVMERLGLGPDVLLARNHALVYARLTGYGQTGPLANTPGHDINYLAMSGVLSAIGRAGQRPLFPVNLLGDYAGGGCLAALGIVAGVLEARGSGVGQVVDAAMVDGVAQLATTIFGFVSSQSWGPAGTNPLDSGAHFYEVYETADGRYVAVGAIEPQFYTALLELLGIVPESAPQWDRDRWPELRERFACAFRSRTRDEWARLAESANACVTPVLTLTEAPDHPLHSARATFSRRGDLLLPRSAPRFSRTDGGAEGTAAEAGQVLKSWGIPPEQIEALRTSGALK